MHRQNLGIVYFFLFSLVGFTLGATTDVASTPDGSLVAGFQNPPVSAQPQTWWHWMNGNITREGITADLEAMHRVGISEANIITVASSIPPGPVPVMSPQFFDMVEWAAKEADRLGMTLCMDNCPGWSSSGGPWVKPEQAMQFVTIGETTVRGPLKLKQKLDQPPSRDGFYRDIAVYAFKTPPSEGELIAPDNHPQISTSVPKVSVVALLDGDSKNPVKLPVPDKNNPYYVQFDFPHALTVRTITITPGPMNTTYGSILASDDGKTFHEICPFVLPRYAASQRAVFLGEKGVTARLFRLEFERMEHGSSAVLLMNVRFSDRVYIPNLAAKAVYSAGGVNPLEVDRDEKVTVPADCVVHRDAMIDLTADMTSEGSLEWNVPDGNWTVLRIGYTPTGVTNHPAPPEATGLECDKLSPEGLDASWNGMMKPLLDRLGPLAGKVLDDCLIDSYETGGQNWTPRMKEEFKKRCGYDLTPFLAVLSGRIVDSPELTERFLWDLRRTIADLFAKNYFGHFTDLCKRNGMKSLVEPYAGPFESLQCGAANDVPMAEFWTGTNGQNSVKMASSVGHIYGQKVIGAESFTGMPEYGSWREDPYSLKALGDLMFCQGINRFIFHRYAHQPWMNRYPGMTMGQWGINLDRTNTWFELAKPWMQYITRCQYLLQQGRSVADVAYFCGQSVPVVSRIGDPPMPKGFDFDEVNADVLMNAKVHDHRIMLSTGASYAVLVLPPSDPEMTPELLQKIDDLVNDGAIVVGRRPEHAPGLQNYPACDDQVHQLAAQLWGKIDGNATTENRVGQGKIISGQTLGQIFSSIHLAPDFQIEDDDGKADLNYIHRTLDGADVFFVANHANGALHRNCSFRISGRVPELWHPETGAVERAPAYEVKNGRIIVPLDFDPTGSVFIVFRKPDSAADHVVTAARQLKEDSAPVTIDGPWQLNFPPHWGAPATVKLDHLLSWPDSSDEGVRYFSGTATYVKDITVPAEFLGDGKMLMLDLGTVKNLAQVKLNGTDLGILWKPPFRLDVASTARPGTNHLVISITNLWPNRLIGDAQLPEDVKWNGQALAAWPQWLLDGKPSPTGRLTFTTWRHITKDMRLLPSGLIGPVTIVPEDWIVARQ